MADARELEKLRNVAAAAWGYRVSYEAYWGEGVADLDAPPEWKAKQLTALVGWQQELDAAISALDDEPGDFEAAKRAHRATIAAALACVGDTPQETPADLYVCPVCETVIETSGDPVCPTCAPKETQR